MGVPRQPYYRTVTDKAGALLRSMVKDHAFVVGNKRLGMAATFLFLTSNDYLFGPTNAQMVSFALELATRSDPPMTWQEVASWIRRHSASLRGDSGFRRYLARHPGETAALKEAHTEFRRALHVALEGLSAGS